MEKDFQENSLKALKFLEGHSSPTQRELSQSLNLSLGKVNYILKLLIEKGLIKASRFKNSNRKSAYFYYLTPKGFEQKLILTKNYLQRKIHEYESIKGEIEDLKRELHEGASSQREDLTFPSKGKG